MQCKFCKGDLKKFGFTRKGDQRYQCKSCYRTMSKYNRNDQYTPEWKRMLIVGLRQNGYSYRQIQALVGCARNTVETYARDVRSNCPCGRPVGHQGWCSHRYANSPRRQQWMKVWHKGGARINPEQLPSYYKISLCPMCRTALKNATMCRACWRKRAELKRIAESQFKGLNNDLKTVNHLIKEIMNYGKEEG